jgi:hypothetical protein
MNQEYIDGLFKPVDQSKEYRVHTVSDNMCVVAMFDPTKQWIDERVVLEVKNVTIDVEGKMLRINGQTSHVAVVCRNLVFKDIVSIWAKTIAQTLLPKHAGLPVIALHRSENGGYYRLRRKRPKLFPIENGQECRICMRTDASSNASSNEVFDSLNEAILASYIKMHGSNMCITECNHVYHIACIFTLGCNNDDFRCVECQEPIGYR